MARPKKPKSEKKDKRLTVYFTEEESQALSHLIQHLNLDKAKIITKALEQYVAQLENPPERIRKAKTENIMKETKEQLNGYVCSRGHTFWLERAWPSPPVSCPACGDRELKETWFGVVRKGFCIEKKPPATSLLPTPMFWNRFLTWLLWFRE